PGGFAGGFQGGGAPAGRGGPGAGGPGGQDGRGGGRGGGGAGRGGAIGGRGFQQNRLNATADYTFGGSALDATPYQLRPDSPADEKPYTQHNFGATLGGRLHIPGLITGTRTSFTFGYTGGRGATPFAQYSTVPTAVIRGRGAAGRGTTASLNVQLQYRKTDADQANTFSTLGGTRSQTTLGVPVGLNLTKGRELHNFNFNFSHTSSHTTNRFAGVTNVAA